MNAPSSSTVITPFYGLTQQGNLMRKLAGAGYDGAYPMTFYDQTQKVRLYEKTGLHEAGFVDFAGNNAISAFEQYQQPPQTFFRPTAFFARPNSGSSFSGIEAAGVDQMDANLYPVTCKSTSQSCRQGGSCNMGSSRVGVPQGTCACPNGTSGAYCQFPGVEMGKRCYLRHGLI